MTDFVEGIAAVPRLRRMGEQRVSKSADVKQVGEAPAGDPRPITATDHPRAKVTKKLPSRGRKNRKATDPDDEDALEIDGWGDFNSDRLLRDDTAASVRRDPGADTIHAGDEDDDDVDLEGCTLSRTAQPTADSTTRRTGARQPSNTAKDQPKQVLRQRALVAMELEPPPLESSPHSVLRKLLVAHRRAKPADSLPRLKTQRTGPVVSPHMNGLFGPDIEDSIAMRARLFHHLWPLWSLMSTSGAATADDARSTFECSMVLMKICKTIGIALSTSPTPHKWLPSLAAAGTARNAKTKSFVDFATFSDFVVRNAIQPTMHHFGLDRDVDEYVHTLDRIVDSLMVAVDHHQQHGDHSTASAGDDTALATCHLRLRELGEIQPVLPRWKKGIQIVQKQAPVVKTTSNDPVEEGEEASVTITLPVARCGELERAKRLPASEARALQDTNIRRKMQLRKSWQPRVKLSETANGQEIDSDHAGTLVSCMRVETVAPDLSSSVHVAATDTKIVIPVTESNQEPQPEQDEQPPQQLLLCGSCTRDEEATLWCSACFAVFCHPCWVTTHHTDVDMTAIDNQKEAPAPTARPLTTQRGDAPPVAMIYLPTKPISTGKLLRGPSTKKNVHTFADEQDQSSVQVAVSSHAILPTLKPPYQHRVKSKHTKSMSVLEGASTASSGASSSSAMNSTANLLKALMVGTASSASVLGLSSESSSSSSSMSVSSTNQRVTQDTRRRLTPAAVTLDVDTLLPR